MWYNDHGLTIQVNFTIKCVCVGFGSSGFVTKMQSFPLDGHYRTNIISDVGYPRLNSIMLLMLYTVRCTMAWARALYYKFLGTTSTLLRKGNISGKLYC
jgi:hypothetical protein